MGGYDTMSAWDRIHMFENGQDIRKRDSVLESALSDGYPIPSSKTSFPSSPPIMAPSFQEATVTWSPSFIPRTLSFKDTSPTTMPAVSPRLCLMTAATRPSSGPRSRKERNRRAQELYRAACDGDLVQIQTLLDTGATVDDGVLVQGLYESFKPAKSGLLSPLAGAAGQGQLDAVELLILHGAEVNPPLNQSSSSPLHQACRNNDSEMAQLLLDLGADINLNNGYNTTPLMYAARYGDVELVEMMLSYKPDTDRQSFIKSAAIHWAVWTGKADVVEALLKGGARPNQCMGDGTTPLHCAATGGHLPVARILLQYGADPKRRNEHYETAAQLAEEAEHYGIVDLLKAAASK